MERNPEIHKYFRLGDIVICESIWGKKRFIIHGFGGNAWLPELYVHPFGKPKTVGNSCNWDVRETRLVGADKRPFRKLDKRRLLILMKKGIEEAKREFIIRTTKI